MSFCKKLILVVAVTPVLLGGCAVFDPVEALPDPRLDQLVSGMDKCLANQAEASVQLRSQGQLLKSQSEQLAVLGIQLGAERGLEQTGKHAAASACPKAEKVVNKQVVGCLAWSWRSQRGWIREPVHHPWMRVTSSNLNETASAGSDLTLYILKRQSDSDLREK